MYSSRSNLSVSLTLLVLIFPLPDGLNSQSITRGPSNGAARHGDSSTLHCTVDRLDDTVEWTFRANGSSEEVRLYLYDGNEEQKPNENYDVDAAGLANGVVDLIMKESSVATAGVYTCGLFLTDQKENAQFVSVAPITCDPPPGQREVLEGATVMLTCDVTYSGYKPPSLSWTTMDSTVPLQGDWVWTNDRSTFSANVTAEPDLDMLDFTCDLGFLSDPGDTGPPPVYNDSCTTHFMVLHGATRIEIVPDPEGVVAVVVGDTINCSASGRPPPTFSWEGDNGEFIMGSILTVLEEWTDLQKTFTCFARNDINGQPAEAILSIEIIVSNPVPPPVTSQGGVEPWVIAIAVIIPILVIAAIVGTVFFIRHKKNKKKKQKEQHLSRLPDGSAPVITMMPDPRATGRRPPDPGPPRRPPPGHKQNGTRLPGPPAHPQYQNAVLMAGMPVPVTPDVDTAQNRQVGGDSPGYGDLGIKQFSSSRSGGLDASSIDLDPGPRNGRRYGSRSSLGVSQGFGGSQHSIGLPPPNHQPPPLGPAPLGNHPMNVLHHMTSHDSTENMRNMVNQHQQLSSGSQMGSQHSLSHMQASRGMMGSRGSLASQGSRQFVNPYELPPDVSDTQV